MVMHTAATVAAARGMSVEELDNLHDRKCDWVLQKIRMTKPE